jgi:hypothetical protein
VTDIEPTHQICPVGEGRTHHLTPKGGTLVCVYCLKSDAELRAAIDSQQRRH